MKGDVLRLEDRLLQLSRYQEHQLDSMDCRPHVIFPINGRGDVLVLDLDWVKVSEAPHVPPGAGCWAQLLVVTSMRWPRRAPPAMPKLPSFAGGPQQSQAGHHLGMCSCQPFEQQLDSTSAGRFHAAHDELGLPGQAAT